MSSTGRKIEWGLVALFVLTVTSPVYAYADPGTGSMIMAAVVALFAATFMAVKTWWYKLVRLFGGRGDAPRDGASPPPRA